MFEKEYYYGYTTSDIQSKSSSGGVFGWLAEQILVSGGIVFGAVYDPKSHRVLYKSTEEVSLEKLMRSKYVQADLGDTYKMVIESLRSKRVVLFCGTPCYVAGLRKLIEKIDLKLMNYLFLIDFLCEGVPSNKVFIAYQNFIEQKRGQKIQDVIFRSKKYGWRLYCMNIKFEKGNDYVRLWWSDLYMSAFLKGLILNRSICYSCSFRENYKSDITLGDFWKCERYDSSCINNKGTSIVEINTAKGKWLLDQCSGGHLRKLKTEMISTAKQDLFRMSTHIDSRNQFYKDFSDIGFEAAARKNNQYTSSLCTKNKIGMVYLFLIKIPLVNTAKMLLHRLGLRRKSIAEN